MKRKIKFKTNIPDGHFEKSPINLIELEKQIKETKIIEKFKDGVVDGLIHGMRDDTQSHHYYNLGYDFGVALHSRQINEEVTPL